MGPKAAGRGGGDGEVGSIRLPLTIYRPVYKLAVVII